MARFFMAGTNLSGGTAIIKGRDAEHIQVLRMRPGERVVICDGKGTDYMCRLIRSDGGEAEAEIVEILPCKAEPSVGVTIFAGLPKGDRADLIVQKCTEAGAAEIVFFDCERCVARPKPDSVASKLERFSRIAESAAQQSGRGAIPAVRFIGSYVEMLDAAIKLDARLFMYEEGPGRVALREGIEAAGTFATAAVITGPEGGFTAAEAAMARGVGFTLCSMGERILRCETAPLIALTAIMYATDNLE
ncbi:MAG: RsmE family RNA methyltransferase [Oscillospiraceae bacterium]